MAIRRETFFRLKIPQLWSQHLSDDYTLTVAVRRNGQRVVFAPAALVASVDHVGGRGLLEWVRRQLLITRFYNPTGWWLALAAHVIYAGNLFFGSWLFIARSSLLAAVAVGTQLVVSLWQSWERAALAQQLLPEFSQWFQKLKTSYLWLAVPTLLLWLVGLAASAFGDEIEWRGHRYRLSHYRTETL